jgi:hypothetical protein
MNEVTRLSLLQHFKRSVAGILSGLSFTIHQYIVQHDRFQVVLLLPSVCGDHSRRCDSGVCHVPVTFQSS